MAVYFAQTSAAQTNANKPTPIPDLVIQLPEGADVNALIIVNLPNPYATGQNYPGAVIGIAVDGNVLPIYASFTYSNKVPESTGRMPTTLVAAVPLTLKQQTVEAVWQGVRGSTVIIDSPATLSAII